MRAAVGDLHAFVLCSFGCAGAGAAAGGKFFGPGQLFRECLEGRYMINLLQDLEAVSWDHLVGRQ